MNELHSSGDVNAERERSAALDARLGETIPVLDHGFIRVVDYMGTDAAVVQAARVSYGRGTKTVNEDRGLIRYLMRHRHSTPFEMCEIKLHVKLPMFVARQWIRHRTANVNEYSARYSILDSEFYLPPADALAAQSKSNNQGRGDALSAEEADRALALLKADGEAAYARYLDLMNQTADGEPVDADRQGLARELARMTLPMNWYTQWYWKVDLHNLLHFVHLRADSHAQAEIRAYADVMLALIRDWVPLTYEAFIDYRRDAVTFSGPAMAVLRRRLAGETVTQEDSGLSAREWRELEATLAD
ncbi:MAG: FAD-dependent thymidylate synthase [Pseudomonadota bacterium]